MLCSVALSWLCPPPLTGHPCLPLSTLPCLSLISMSSSSSTVSGLSWVEVAFLALCSQLFQHTLQLCKDSSLLSATGLGKAPLLSLWEMRLHGSREHLGSHLLQTNWAHSLCPWSIPVVLFCHSWGYCVAEIG